jgi:hypothetical protein
MPEWGSSGSVRGDTSNGVPYRDRSQGEVRLDHNQLGIVRRASADVTGFGVPEHHGSAAISTSISG